LLDGAGALFLGVAIFVYSAQNSLRAGPTPGMADFGGGAQNFALISIFWFSGFIGLFSFLCRPLLWLQWWYSWIAFLAFGGVLWAGATSLFDGPIGRISGGLDFSHDPAFNVQCVGVASILMGFIFLIAQWLVRRAVPENKEETL
jgi:hypothetical protein